jgi:ArsR family transcriptional regulator, arsenate/arsenite/antimonite-responsive transcriptional repressor
MPPQTLIVVDVLCRPHLASDIDGCQYVLMSKSLLELTPVETVACCSPLTKEPLSEDQARRIAPLLKALADPVRLRLLSLVASHGDGEACVCDLNDAFDLSQPTISHHLKVLHEVGLLDRTKRGVWVYYSVKPDALADLGALIGGVAG